MCPPSSNLDRVHNFTGHQRNWLVSIPCPHSGRRAHKQQDCGLVSYSSKLCRALTQDPHPLLRKLVHLRLPSPPRQPPVVAGPRLTRPCSTCKSNILANFPRRPPRPLLGRTRLAEGSNAAGPTGSTASGAGAACEGAPWLLARG